MDFIAGEISRETFIADYWRKKPFFLKGGAKKLLQTSISAEEFARTANTIETSNPQMVKRDGDRLVFAQRWDSANQRFKKISTRIAQTMSWPDVWFDGVLASDGHSIGCHYDDSDNFVLQQEGTKIWKLHPPTIIPQEELRQRMLKNPEVGNIFMPENAIQFVLEPGDLLYIPIFWPHWGVSEGPSLSVSFVCNTSNAVRELIPVIREVLSHEPLWWEPLPMFPVPNYEKGMDLAKGDAKPLESVMDNLLDVFQQASFRQKVIQSWWERRAERIWGSHQQKETPTSGAQHLAIDKDWVRKISGPPLEAINVKNLVSIYPATLQTLQRYTFRIYLKRFLLSMSKGFGMLNDYRPKEYLQTLLSTMQRMDAASLTEAFHCPEFTSWIKRFAEAIQFGYPPRLEQLLYQMGGFWIAYFLQKDILLEQKEYWVSRSTSHTWQLPSLGMELVSDHELPEVFPIEKQQADILIKLGDSCYRLPASFFVQGARKVQISDSLRWEPLPFLPAEKVAIIQKHDWYKPLLSHRKEAFLEDPAFQSFSQQVVKAIHQLKETWPEAYKEFRQSVYTILPYDSDLPSKDSDDLRMYRGLAYFSPSAQRPILPMLLIETARNRLHAIMDVFQLFHNPARSIPASNGKEHQAQGWLEKLVITLQLRQLATRSGGELSLEWGAEPYRVSEIISLLSTCGELTENGQRFLEGCTALETKLATRL
ncbi:JmjC domain-containing protein [Salinithrix halophila]|uniref:JmjC domain-containing protein n=1 Tax=Salinithrix halophila TaxID=1485204 RepID=A0ABV8JIW9_9BACL